MERIVSQILQADLSESDNFEGLVGNEVELLIKTVDTEPLDYADMVQDRKAIVSLCLLYTSMKWLATKTAHLRHISDRATNSARAESARERHTQRWTMLTSSEPRAEGAPVYLPLDRELVGQVIPVLVHNIF